MGRKKKEEKLDLINKKEKEKQKNPFFEHLKNLTYKKKSFDIKDEKMVKEFNIYRIIRYISMVELFIPLANVLNKFQGILSKESIYEVLLNTLPQRSYFFSYIKKPKEDIDKRAKECLMKYFEFGSEDLDLALDVLTENQINEIIHKFDGGKK